MSTLQLLSPDLPTAANQTYPRGILSSTPLCSTPRRAGRIGESTAMPCRPAVRRPSAAPVSISLDSVNLAGGVRIRAARRQWVQRRLFLRIQ
jgi:hypothetical protein